jgi:hypothetical protein
MSVCKVLSLSASPRLKTCWHEISPELHKLIRSNEQDQSYAMAAADKICNEMWEGRAAYKAV